MTLKLSTQKLLDLTVPNPLSFCGRNIEELAESFQTRQQEDL